MFCKNRIGTAARSGDQVQIPGQTWYFVTRVKIEGSLARNARFAACTCVVLSAWLCSGSAVSMGEAAETYLFRGVTRSLGFPLASQYLWGKLQQRFFFKVS